ncbi:MAG: hypothetical protein QM489_06205 [Candidatus Izemoplasma sp.]
MKKIALLLLTFTFIFLVTACDDACVGPSCTESTGTTLENVIPFIHINGEGHETEKNAFILYEYAGIRDYMKYQITFLSCTCRPADYNYWQVMFIEINKSSNDIRTISFGSDGGHYTAGMWGDSSPTPSGITLTDFETDFIPWLIGKDLSDFEGISVFTNKDYFGIKNPTTIAEQDLIDAYVGSSVSTNNMIRVIKELLIYHETAY